MGKILAVCKNSKKGLAKKNAKRGVLKEDYGLIGDAHAGPGLRQISLLAKEDLDEMKKKGLKIGCGGFGENLTVSKLELTSLVIGTRLKAGEAILEVTKIGKTCKKPCGIYKRQGSCILPSQGVFARVIRGGVVSQNDAIGINLDKKISTGVLVVSDRGASGQRCDKSGRLIIDALKAMGAEAVRYKVIPDDREVISSTLRRWSDEEKIDLLLTSGGTGFSPRDVTPEATKEILNKEAPGLAEMLRARSAEKTEFAYLSRGIAGIRKKTLIINLPGSPRAASDCMSIILPIISHAIEVMKGKVKDCHHQQ
ncbi:molybdopterin-binding protein [Omnitrophica bacterium]|nr:molybdopterin-binding protein [Candidatus Omnitrophota bacterium]